MTIESSGILIIDKPPEITSAKVVALLKKKAGYRKVGHTGTLDPFATGVLICCVNQATRIARFFLHGRKTYEGTLVLGVETDTLDRTGVVTARCDTSAINPGQITAAFKKFQGEIEQVPPVYSALKYNGVPLYKLARKGRPVKKPARKVLISKLRVLQIDFPRVDFEVECSAGTYIRSLCADIGKELGCGAYLERLRRTKSCGFTVDQALSLDALQKRIVQGTLADSMIDMNQALHDMPGVVAGQAVCKKVEYGQPIGKSDLADEWLEPLAGSRRLQGYLKIIDPDGNLKAVLDTHTQKDGRYDYCCAFPP